MICTSNYKQDFSSKHKLVSISGDRGKKEEFNGECFSLLAPKKDFWEIWHSNIGNALPADNNRYYITEFYKQVLSKLDCEDVYNMLDGSILLCYEKNYEFCHRQIVAAWFELFLDIEVPEIKVKNGNIQVVERDSSIKHVLEQVIRENVDMKGFKSLRGYYLNEKSKKCTMEAIKLERNGDPSYIDFKNKAYQYKVKALLFEKEYLKNPRNVK